MNTHLSHVRRLVTGIAAVGALALAGSVTATTLEPAAPEPIVVSAAGNVIQPDGPVIQPVAIYYYGYFRTQARCLQERDTYMATGNYRRGNCWQSNEGRWKGWWRLWMEDYSSPCCDRVAPASVAALPESAWGKIITPA